MLIIAIGCLATGCQSNSLFQRNEQAISLANDYVAQTLPTPDMKTDDGSGAVRHVAYLQDESQESVDSDLSDPAENNSGEDDSVAVESPDYEPTVNVAVDGPSVQGPIGTLQAITSLALSINPTIHQREAELQALRGKFVQAGLPPNPTAGIIGDDINEDGGAGRYGVYFGRTIVRGGKLCLAQKQISAEIKAQEVLLAEIQQRLMTDVRLRYYDLLVAIEKANMARQLVDLSQNAVDATSQLVQAKELARTSLLQSELELQKATVTQQTARNEVVATRRNLAALIDEPDLPFDSFAGSLDVTVEMMDIELAFERLISESPEIARMYANVNIAKRNLGRQCAQRIPNVTWQTTFKYDLANDDVLAGFQVGMPIMKYDRNQGAICEARHQIVAQEHLVEKTALQLRERLVAAYRGFVDAKLQVDALNAEILPKAQETLDLISMGYREGEVSFLELLTAQRTYFQINLENIQQVRAMWQQRILIEGMLLSGSLD